MNEKNRNGENGMHSEKPLSPLWEPSPERVEKTLLARFVRKYGPEPTLSPCDFAAVHRWSIEAPEAFWSAVWQDGGVIGVREGPVLENPNAMPGARWFPQSRLNFAQNLLRARDERDALVFWGEDKVKNRMTHAELYRKVAQCAAALREEGVLAGDRVAAYLPNLPETVIVMLATASLGAVFTSASPDFGVQGVLDRFGQTQPKVLFGVDGYFYNGKTVDCRAKLAEVAARLPDLKRTVQVNYVFPGEPPNDLPHGRSFEAYLAPFHDVTEIPFPLFAFDHPLYILYSSGTTGVPKCIVHGAGGVLLQHLKEHRLHADIHPGDRLFYFTTCGWMMWNWLVSGLAAGACVLLYDGSPFAGGGNILFDYAKSEKMTHFGTSAKFIDACAKAGLSPIDTHDLSALRTLLSTGSPLSPEGFDYVYQHIKADLCLSSISGGTDIVSCFVLGNPAGPVFRGQIQCKGLGMAVDVFDEEGHPIRGEKGELVCVRPFPSMPLGFWNDPDGSRYQAAYFERFKGVWCHGDFCEITPENGLIIYGRSDATLNPGGVRIGTAEIYRQVEKLDEVVESIVIGQDWEGDVRVVLFVRLREGLHLDAPLKARIREAIRRETTPRHVPACIVQVPDIPRTKSGKIVELAVRHTVHGQTVKNIEALANPEALAYYQNHPELQA
jgi:acetoacetyl-CoA synthetase